MRRAGFQPSKPQGVLSPGGSSSGKPDKGSEDDLFYDAYPQYLTPQGNTRVDLITIEAEKLALRFEKDGLRRHQLRAFYDHAKRQFQRLAYVSFGEVHPEIARLKIFAADRASRSINPLPTSFRIFIDRNVDAVSDEMKFRKGFMPHFEAVVAYCARLRDS
jgi:CRISPR/Cas system CSM-associated protein Csm2 small subunit